MLYVLLPVQSRPSRARGRGHGLRSQVNATELLELAWTISSTLLNAQGPIPVVWQPKVSQCLLLHLSTPCRSINRACQALHSRMKVLRIYAERGEHGIEFRE